MITIYKPFNINIGYNIDLKVQKIYIPILISCLTIMINDINIDILNQNPRQTNELQKSQQQHSKHHQFNNKVANNLRS